MKQRHRGSLAVGIVFTFISWTRDNAMHFYILTCSPSPSQSPRLWRKAQRPLHHSSKSCRLAPRASRLACPNYPSLMDKDITASRRPSTQPRSTRAPQHSSTPLVPFHTDTHIVQLPSAVLPDHLGWHISTALSQSTMPLPRLPTHPDSSARPDPPSRQRYADTQNADHTRA